MPLRVNAPTSPQLRAVMTPDQFRDTLRRLGLPQVRAATLLGVDGRTVRRWVGGERPIPEMVARVLRAAERGKLDLRDLE